MESTSTAPARAGSSARVPSAATSLLEYGIVFILLVGPLAGVIAAPVMFWGHGISRLDVGLFVATYLFTGFGITVGFHRLFSHRSFSVPTWVRTLLALGGSMALQGPVVNWVADHRRHHAHADREGDPHSPNIDEGGTAFSSRAAGLWHAHWGWIFNGWKTRELRFAPDLQAEPLIRQLDRLYLLWAALSLGIPPAVGALVTGTSAGAWSAFVWAVLVRVFAVHHLTWCVNSIGHWAGARPFGTRDGSTNCWWLAIPTLGESWHNGHHAFPTSAVHGLLPGQVDVSGALIRTMSSLGLATDVKEPTAEQIAARLAS
jgi:stearoyl-CoA desaturase (delta-9 desaturase)